MSRRVDLYPCGFDQDTDLVTSNEEGSYLVLSSEERSRLKRFVDYYIIDRKERDKLFDILDGTDVWGKANEQAL